MKLQRNSTFQKSTTTEQKWQYFVGANKRQYPWKQ